MALQKSISLPSGVTGNYIRISAFRWDRSTSEASALFSLWLDAATAAKPGATALVPCIAKLRLEGAAFDRWLGNAALGEADVLGQIYAAAQVEPCISDHGPDVLKGAVQA